MNGATGLTGIGVIDVTGIRDQAGNAMRATELNGDTVINIFLGEGFDYGDAPDPLYASLRDSNGPRHKVANGFSLGPTVNADPDARLIDADIDDGVSFGSIVVGFTGSMQLTGKGITVSKPGFASAWIDFNGNGIFESSEKINIPGRVANGLNAPIQFNVPGSTVVDRQIAARIRFSSDEASIQAPTGDAPDGEVEDYLLTISRNPYTNPNNRFDVTGDGFVSPIDVLQIVNYINSGLPPRPPIPPVVVPPYLDVDSNGFVDPLDVLAVINYINSNISGGNGAGGEGEGSSGLGDLWLAASAAPVVKSLSQANRTDDSAAMLSMQSNALQVNLSLDLFLASLANQEMGPMQADESIDLVSSSTAANQNENSRSDLVNALDDVLQELL
jgi:hypothetical protein